MHEDKLPLLDFVRLFHKRQRRQTLHEHRRRIARREPVEQFHRLGRVGQRVLGETTPRRVGCDFVADFEPVGGFVDAFADGNDLPCALVSENVRQRDFVHSTALVPVGVPLTRSAPSCPIRSSMKGGTQRVDEIVPCVFDADEDLTGPRSWDFDLSNLDHANVALFEDLSGAHLGGNALLVLLLGRHGAGDVGEAGLRGRRWRQGGRVDVGEQATRRRADNWRQARQRSECARECRAPKYESLASEHRLVVFRQQQTPSVLDSVSKAAARRSATRSHYRKFSNRIMP